MRKLLSFLLVLVLVLTPLTANAAPATTRITTTPTGYDSADDVRYVTTTVNGRNVISNWGARGETCVFLSKYVDAYYPNSYDTMATWDGGTSTSATSSEMYRELKSLMTSAHTYYTYYDGNKNVRDFYKYTDCVSNDTSKVSLIYQGTLVSSAWDAGKTWNQEHCAPQSLLSGSQSIGDIMHLRPSNPSENSSRGNKPYGTKSGSYNPGVSVRGDCARMVLYMHVRWGTSLTSLIDSVDLMLQWMEEDPVDTWEMARNDSVQSITGVRNVFVDYPELAWLMYSREVPSDMTTPSGEAKSNSTTPPTTEPTTAPTEAPSTGLSVITTPVAGTAYKFGMIQSNVSTTDVYYLNGAMNGYYMNTTTDASSAIDVYLQATTGGYYLYTTIGGVKTYINMVVSGTHINGAYEATASTVYTYDADSDTLIAVVNGSDYWFGTRNDKTYTTVGPCAVSYAGFYCKFYGVASEPIEPPVTEPTTEPTAEPTTEPTTAPTTAPVTSTLPPVTAPVAGTTYKFGMYQVNNGHTVYIAGGIDQDRYLITTTDKNAALNVTVEASGNGYKFAVVIGGSKLYITAGTNSAGKVALSYTAAGSVFTYDAAISAWCTDISGTAYYVGSYNNFDTMSLSKTSYINADNAGVTQFPAGFYAADSSEPIEPPIDEPTTEPSTEPTTEPSVAPTTEPATEPSESSSETSTKAPTKAPADNSDQDATEDSTSDETFDPAIIAIAVGAIVLVAVAVVLIIKSKKKK